MDFSEIKTNIEAGGIWGVIFSIGAAVVVTLVGTLVAIPVMKWLKKVTDRTATDWDNVAFDLVNTTQRWVITLWLFYVFARGLDVRENYLSLIKTTAVIAATIQVVIWALRCIRNWRDRKLARVIEQDVTARAPIGLMSTVAEVLVVAVLVLVGLSNLGVDIGALVAGLGIGGVAVALAAQNILGDLFASFSIIFDKPFIIGDSIQVGDEIGTVENIGLKTTRVKSLTGEQLIFSNKDLLESRIRNYKRMSERRVRHRIRVSFDTPVEILRQLPALASKLLALHEKVRFDYCKFIEIGEYSYNYEIVFWVLDPTFNIYLQKQESFFLDFLVRLSELGIKLASPTYHVQLASTRHEHQVEINP